MDIKSTEECGDKCLRTNACWSYEYSPSYKECNLMKATEPNNKVYMDYAFCVFNQKIGCGGSTVAKLLLQHNASVKAKTDDGKTALDIAIENDCTAEVAALRGHS